MSETENLGYELDPASGIADSLCVMLHGYGGDGDDMLNVGAEMSVFLPNTHFIAPNGPEPCLTEPGYFQWYRLEGGGPGADVAAELLAPRINRYADEQLARLGLDGSRLIMLGFSQGGGIMLEAALRRSSACAGVLVFTGSLRNRHKLHEVVQSRPPIMIIHGDEDEVVPPDQVLEASEELGRHGVVCGYHFCRGLGHSLNEEGAMVGAMFASDCLYSRNL